MTPLAGGPNMFAGIALSDLEFISAVTLVFALVISVAGMVWLRALAAKSVAVMVSVIVLTSVLSSLAGVGVIA